MHTTPDSMSPALMHTPGLLNEACLRYLNFCAVDQIPVDSILVVTPPTFAAFRRSRSSR